MRVSDPRLHKPYGRDVRNLDMVVWQREREIMLSPLTPSSLKPPAMRTHVFDIGDLVFVEPSPYDLMWGIRYRGDAFCFTPVTPVARCNIRRARFWKTRDALPRSLAASDAPPFRVSSGHITL